ncbi:hypothetical protein SSBR45G_11500 [Bradyrhizobium sp. SSBR45G]|uniref:hypothetical protein n=1 Tax=unclassified Bradyrhizobium TaxID=2631580 RepID=UPI0023429324|nr:MULTISPECIES: hypothetical protein [unclassified Bradyrhizobium]GLH76242.1 hypothetical protein SSBR45G_11500 [Bradyrhizobium sp. SSBR45G]GLH83275.1 hypothetical protein SSBR45R_07350 [Bradyrhizobium sp. SSBR45R]
MRPLGYMAKKIATSPHWLNVDQVADIYSVSACISVNFADYIDDWKHNGYWVFDSPDIIEELARTKGVDLSATTVFYYEAYEVEYDETTRQWSAFAPEPSLTTDVREPVSGHLEGFDVVSFWSRTSPECSPLSCCSVAKDVAVNAHCLFATFDEAKAAVERGLFDNTEPGPFRILAVYTIGEPSTTA